MSLINLIKELDQDDRVSGIYVGTVVDNKDPLMYGRVKVRVPELHGTTEDISNDDLPWALLLKSNYLGKGSTQFYVPVVGTQVTLVFSRNDIYSPIYIGELSGKWNSNELQSVDYPNTTLIQDTNSNQIINNLNKKELTINYDGKIIAAISQNVDISNENFIMNTTNTINISASNYNLNGSTKVSIDTNECSINANKVTITSPTTITGDTTINGSLSVSSSITAASASISGSLVVSGSGSIAGKDFSTHVHGGVTPGPGTTTPPV